MEGGFTLGPYFEFIVVMYVRMGQNGPGHACVNDSRQFHWVYGWSIRARTKYWSNLTRVIDLAGGDAEVRGVFRTNSKRGALTAIKIVKHYGGESSLYKVEEITGL